MTINSEIERLFKANYEAMLRLALATVHDSDAANDIVHGVFASLLSTGLTAAVDRVYLLRATRDRALDHLRNLDARHRIAELYTLDACVGDEYTECMIPDYEHISRLIGSSLTPQTATVVRLRFYGGLKYADISEELGISEAAVYKHLRRAIEILRPIIKKYGQN